MLDSVTHIPHLPPSYATAPSRVLTKKELSHLAACRKCRESLSYSKELAEQLDTLQQPSVPHYLLPAVQERLLSGEQFLLPISGTIEPFRKIGWIAAAALLLAGISLWSLWPRETIMAAANVGDLHFAGTFLPGHAVSLTYRDHGLFQGETTLRLRGRFRTVDDVEYNHRSVQLVAATLRRQGDVFVGKFVVPSGVVFGAFAVENADGRRVDSNGGRLWTQLREITPGHPSFDALTQAMYDAMGVSLEEALVILQRRAAAYPDSVQGWGEVVAYGNFMLGKPHADSTKESHMRRLTAFHNKYRNLQHVPIQIADGLAEYAITLETETTSDVAASIARFWGERVRAYTTPSRWAIGRHLSTYVPIAQKDPRAALDSMDKAWDRGESPPYFAGYGFNFALQAKDSSGLVRWTKRYAIANRQDAAVAYGLLLRQPKLRELGLTGLRQTLRDLYAHDDQWRPLDKSVAEYARDDSAKAGEVLARIAEGLDLAGAKAASLDTLTLATKTGWNPSLFRIAGNSFLKAGDTTKALAAFAMAAVDPNESDSVVPLMRPFSTGRWKSLWSRYLDSARYEMEKRVMADAISRRLPGSPRIADARGRFHDIRSLAGHSVHVVTFWSRYCAPSRRDFTRLESLARDLSKHGIPLFPISQESRSASLDSFVAEQKVNLPLFYDPTREAGRAFNQWVTPVYFVIDGEGVIRFANSPMDRVLTEAVAVQLASRR